MFVFLGESTARQSAYSFIWPVIILVAIFKAGINNKIFYPVYNISCDKWKRNVHACLLIMVCSLIRQVRVLMYSFLFRLANLKTVVPKWYCNKNTIIQWIQRILMSLFSGTPFDLDISSSSQGIYKHTYNLTWTVKTYVSLDKTEISWRKTVGLFWTIIMIFFLACRATIICQFDKLSSTFVQNFYPHKSCFRILISI